jgi:hypothetical protein
MLQNCHDALYPHSYLSRFEGEFMIRVKLAIILIILQDKYPCLRARVYRTFDNHPQFTKVVTQSTSSSRYAFLHGVLRGRIQPFIHTCNVTVIDKHGGHHNFCFVFKNHRDLPINQCVEALCPNTRWKGDIAILRIAVRFDGVVGMRAGDHKLADFALKKYVGSLCPLLMFLIFWYRCVKHIQLGRHLRMKKNATLIFSVSR